jgi:hypothetical protein
VHWWGRGAIAVGVVFMVPLTSMVLFGVGSDGSPPSPTERLVAFVVLNGFMVLCLVGVWRVTMTGAFVDGNGVVIRSFAGRRRFAWEEITAFDAGPLTSGELAGSVRLFVTMTSFIAQRPECLRLHLTDGRILIVHDVNASMSTWLGTKPPEIAARLEACRPVPPAPAQG